jgi:hypothetical protein
MSLVNEILQETDNNMNCKLCNENDLRESIIINEKNCICKNCVKNIMKYVNKKEPYNYLLFSWYRYRI